MKKLASLFVGLFFSVLCLHAQSQTKSPADYFVGSWNVAVEGTPGGDGKMVVMLERKDGKLGGTIVPKPGADAVKLSKVEETEKSVKVYFNTQGYDVYLLMEKKDDDHVTGNVMDMFDAKGERTKQTAAKQ